MQAIMKRAIFAIAALTLVATSTGCCCFERMFCSGCGGCGAYGHEGPCDGGCGAGCGGSGCSDCGMAGGSVNGPDGYADSGMGGDGYIEEQLGPGSYAQRPAGGKNHPANHHPLVHQRRNAGGQYEFAAGPPTAGVTYPYYTNRGPRDFLAKNPRSIGP
jgi:hypothetical protein